MPNDMMLAKRRIQCGSAVGHLTDRSSAHRLLMTEVNEFQHTAVSVDDPAVASVALVVPDLGGRGGVGVTVRVAVGAVVLTKLLVLCDPVAGVCDDLV